jgi:hypothetical protein
MPCILWPKQLLDYKSNPQLVSGGRDGLPIAEQKTVAAEVASILFVAASNYYLFKLSFAAILK